MQSTQKKILSPSCNLVTAHSFNSYTPPKNMTGRKARDTCSSPSTMKNGKPVQELGCSAGKQ
jgi:hypothetical protein